MHLIIRKSTIEYLWFLFLPTITIISQFLQIGPIRISWLLYIAVSWLVIRKTGEEVLCKPLFLLTSIIILYPPISYLWSQNRIFEGNLYVSLITGAIYTAYIYMLTENSIDSFLDGCFFSCVLFSLWGLYEALTGHYILFQNGLFVYRINPFGYHYPGVAFPNTNDLAQYIAILSPVVSVYEWNKHSNIIHSVIIGLFICNTFVIYQCFSHLGMIAMLLSYCIILFNTMRSRRLRYSFLILLTAIGVIVIILAYRTKLISNIFLNLLLVRRNNVHFTGRQMIYSRLLRQALDHPFGGFGNAYAVENPHNFFLYLLCDFGMLGGLLMIILFVSLGIRIFAYRRTGIHNGIYLGLWSSLITFPLTSSISSGNEQRKIIWIFIGLCMYFIYRITDTGQDDINRDKSLDRKIP